MPAEKLTPQSLESEIYVIGALLLNENAIAEVAGVLRPEHFYRALHRDIYRAALKMFEAGHEISAFDLAATLTESGADVEIAYLMACLEQVPGWAAIGRYAAIVIEKAQLRAMIVESEKAIIAARQSDAPAGEQIDNFQNRLFALAHTSSDSGLKPIAPDVDKVAETLEARRKNKNQVIGVPTGFHDLDGLTGGLHATELSIVAGRPSTGKTALVMQIAANVATGGQAFGGGMAGSVHEPLPVAFLSLEMSTPKLLTRLISQVAGVDGQKMVRGYTDDFEHQRVKGASLLLRRAVMRVEQTPGMSPAEIMASLRRMALEVGQLGLVVCDYLQLIEAEERGDNRVRELDKVCRMLVKVAKTFEVPVIALSQLSRSVEMQETPRPTLRHLNESGGIEANADNVHLLYRPGYYEKLKGREISDPVTEIITAKNRNGPVDTTLLNFRPEFARFENRARQAQERYAEGQYAPRYANFDDEREAA